jgi:hypothetical protein
MAETRPSDIPCAEGALDLDIIKAIAAGAPTPEPGTYQECRVANCIGGAVVCDVLTASGLAVRHALAPGETPDGYCRVDEDSFQATLQDPQFGLNARTGASEDFQR